MSPLAVAVVWTIHKSPFTALPRGRRSGLVKSKERITPEPNDVGKTTLLKKVVDVPTVGLVEYVPIN